MPKKSYNIHMMRLASRAISTLVAAFLCCISVGAIAQQVGQKTFASPEDAAAALSDAAQSGDEKALLEILGPEERKIVSSGDAKEDAESRTTFVQRYREMHRLVNEPDGSFTLYVGAKNWPSPVPIVATGQSWFFDTATAKREILFRRIGRNELSTIRVCQELIAAEEQDRGTGRDISGKIFSDAGRHDGLYWPAGAGEIQSPIGPLVASAIISSDINRSEHPLTPYRGYYFRVLTLPDKNAVGDVKGDLTNGKTTKRLAFIAFPAEYGSSGVKTFEIGGDGIAYEKDLGRNTSARAKSITSFKPNSSWHKIEALTESSPE